MEELIPKKKVTELLWTIECDLIDLCEDNEVMVSQIGEYFINLKDKLKENKWKI